MGVAGALVGGALLGMGLSSMGNRNQSSSANTYTNSIAYENTPAATVPVAPEAPTAEDGSKSDAVLAAEEEERKRRAAEAEANKTNYTSGLGVTTPANIGKNSLLG